MSFHDINLPRFMEVFAICKPEFSVSIAETVNGRELRSIDQEYAKQHYVLQNCRLSPAEFAQLNNFFCSRRGNAYSFRFRDLADYKVNKQLIGIGDGNKSAFQLFKIYDDAVLPYVRMIYKPAKNKVKIFIGEEETEAQIDYDTGIVTLPQPLIEYTNLIAEFEFDVEVRFTDNNFNYHYCSDGSIELASLNLIEVYR